jgi:hypothetical protein
MIALFPVGVLGARKPLSSVIGTEYMVIRIQTNNFEKDNFSAKRAFSA